jgi:hypothetical protein
VRPRKPKNPDDEEDAPVYIDAESGDTVSKAEMETFMKGEDAKDPGDIDSQPQLKGEAKTTEDENKTSLSKETIAAIGAGNRKRNVKAIGVEENTKESHTSGDEQNKQRKKKPTGKKAKKVKLSFDEEG